MVRILIGKVGNVLEQKKGAFFIAENELVKWPVKHVLVSWVKK